MRGHHPRDVSLLEPGSPLAGHNGITKSSRAIPLTFRPVVPASPIREGAMAILSIPQGKARSVLALTCAAALSAACGGAAPSSAAPATPGGAPQTITVTMTEFAFALDHPPNGPGAYVFHAVNAGKYPHSIELDGAGVSAQTSSTVQPRGTTDLTATLQACDLDMYCSTDGHRAKGMETHLSIAAAGS